MPTLNNKIINPTKKPSTVHKYIDEAGDPNFFGKGGVNIVGKEGVSVTFTIGMVSIKNESKIKEIEQKIVDLALSIEQNPFYNTIPSVKKSISKYGHFVFHAKNDVPEIRKELFDLLFQLDFSFQCVVGRKISTLFINKHNKNENEFYADLLSHLLKDKINQKLVLNIARRGNSTNNVNLELAVSKATKKYLSKNGLDQVKCNIVCNVQDYDKEPLLTIADYCLWVVQRVFEKGEIRFYNYLLPKILLVVDLYDLQSYNDKDNNGKKLWTNYYDNKKNPLKESNKISPPSS
jgi:Protein of unknown function (DUF3800)